MDVSQKYTELTYANSDQPLLKRNLIRLIESLSGRKQLLAYYDTWRTAMLNSGQNMWTSLLDLINLKIDIGAEAWPPANLPDGPLVLIANHPYGIGDGLAFLSLAEKLDRPYRILINKELLKAPEIMPYALPVDFDETEDALRTNMRTRREALALLNRGVTIVVFPGGGVATARRLFGRAQELPWKTFTAKLVRSAKASVIPLWFEGQNGTVFHVASWLSMTLRTSLFIREFKKLLGSSISVRIGHMIGYDELATFSDQKSVIDYLHSRVHALGNA